MRLLSFLFFISVSLFAQVRLDGLVVDSLNQPLELANIMAINSNTNAIDAYGVSNSDGEYTLELKENSNYQLKISYVGMESFLEDLQTKQQPIRLTSVLKEDSKLKELELVYEMPITISGDTLTYKTDAFTNGEERKLEDVLDKLPGVEITDEGEVKVEGKVVDKIMVEGKEFFDGDTKLATKNIPADALEKIEVLKNFSEVGMMKNLGGNEDNVALNIRLKDGKKNFWFGDVKLGAGPNSRYIAHPKLFFYSPKFSVNVITDVNNIGEIPFTLNDYFKFSGGLSALNSGSSLNLNDPALRFLMAQNNKARSIETKFSAANINYSVGKHIDLTGFVILSDTKTKLEERNKNTYFSDQLPNEETTSNVWQNNRLGLAKLSLKYEPNPSAYLVYDAFGKLSEQSQENDFFSTVYGRIGEESNLNPKSIQQNLNYYKSFSTKDILSVELQHLYKDEDPFYNALLQKSGQFQFVDVLHLDTNQNAYQLNQDKQTITNKIDLKTRYWYILNKKSNISALAGYSDSRQRFSSNLYQILDNKSQLDLYTTEARGQNSVNYSIQDAYVGLQYRLKTGIFTLHPGIDFHTYKVENSQDHLNTIQRFNRWLPMVNIRAQLKKSEHMTLSYNAQTQFTDVNTLAEGVVLNRYNSLFQGNKQLEHAITHVYSLGYFNFNQFTFTNIFANLNYVKTENPVSVNTRFLNQGQEGLDQIGGQLNSNFANESINAEFNLEKTVGKMKGKLEGRWSYSKFNPFLNEERQINESFTQDYGIKVKSNYRKGPNVEVGYDIIVDRYLQVGLNTMFYTHKPYIKVKARFLKHIRFQMDYSHYIFTNADEVLNRYGFLNSSVSYQKKDAKFEYTLQATNVLNNKSINSSQSTRWSTSATQFFVQPRYLVLSATYHL